MKSNKNLTLYKIILAGVLLTIPIAYLIISKFTNSSNFYKAFLITAVFVVITVAINILYVRIFNVSMDEISQNTKVTELDKKQYWLMDYLKRNRHMSKPMQRLITNVQKVIAQTENYERRKVVYISLLDESQRERGNSLWELIATVEKALNNNVDKIINRINIFDDKVQVSIVEKNLEYIEDYLDKNENLLINFEKLITEVSSMSNGAEDDLSKLTDIINAMESLRTEKDEDITQLINKYK
ncbi:MAG: hypothetical protein K0S61_3368 [Anaerocolumna sp.]|jgi:uncharacterized membrane protein|nr:hypothetical protein [Anaerocolumna sp.]